jgi:hypothetical protein
MSIRFRRPVPRRMLVRRLTVTQSDQVVFGLGFSGLTADNGTPTLVVSDSATGAILAGFSAGGSGTVIPGEQVEIGITPDVAASPGTRLPSPTSARRATQSRTR